MNKTFRASLAGVLAAGALAVPSSAHALGPVDLEVAAKAGGGSSLYSGTYGPNPLGFGLGGRAGVAFLGLYGGIMGMYYFGGSSTGPSDAVFNAAPGSISAHAVQYGFEGGFNVSILGLVTVRPQLGVGNLDLTVGGADQSNVYLEPGATGLVTLGQFLVGADANALWVPGLSHSNAAFTAHGQIGVRF